MAFGKSSSEPGPGFLSSTLGAGNSGVTTGVVPLTAQPMTSTNQAQLEAFLGKGSKVVGTLTFSGPADIDGFVEGEIVANERLTIGEAAVVNAKISGAEIVVKGTVTGDIVASKRLSLKKPARITGNIMAVNLSIEEGVVFEGKCSMGASVDSKITDSKITGIGSKISSQVAVGDKM